MGASKGNQNAVKDNPKSTGYHLKMRPDTLLTIKNIAQREKIPMSQLIEKALLKAYPKELSGKF